MADKPESFFVKVPHPKLSPAVQKALFKLGHSWFEGGQTVKDIPYGGLHDALCNNFNGYLGHSPYNFFVREGGRFGVGITIEQLVQKVEVLTPKVESKYGVHDITYVDCLNRTTAQIISNAAKDNGYGIEGHFNTDDRYLCFYGASSGSHATFRPKFIIESYKKMSVEEALVRKVQNV